MLGSDANASAGSEGLEPTETATELQSDSQMLERVPPLTEKDSESIAYNPLPYHPGATIPQFMDPRPLPSHSAAKELSHVHFNLTPTTTKASQLKYFEKLEKSSLFQMD